MKESSTLKYDNLQNEIRYQFKNIASLELAMTHKSAGSPNNERLEFLGDSLLNMIVAEALFLRHEDIAEGTLTTARAQMVKAQTLSEIGYQLGLDELLVLGLGERRSSSIVRESIVGDAVEALIAAIYLDSDFANCQRVVLSWFSGRLEQVADYKDAKTSLQELMQSQKLPLPKYSLVDVSGPGHKQHFTVDCSVRLNNTCARGEGASRRIAEQEAAAAVLASLQVEAPYDA